MELSGKIIKVLPLQSGTGKNGVWKKQEYIIESNGQIPRKVCFSLWGDKIDQFKLQEGLDAEVMFDIESREFNGRWYTEVKAWKVTRKSADNPYSAQGPPPEDFDMPAGDGMPF
jgi:hypothetical protein